MKKYFVLSLILLSILLTSCFSSSNEGNEGNKIKLGLTSAPHGVIVEDLKEDFKQANLDIEVYVFDDYIQLNHALADKSLDANYFQHKPFFDNFIKEHNLNLSILGYVHIEPMGFYSTKYKSIDELQDRDEILIPNDVSNGARALFLLEEAGLIKLARRDFDISIKDIVENKKNLKITPLNAATITSSYEDVAGGIINSNFVISAGLDVKKALITEKSIDNPYANLVAVRKGEENQAKMKKLLEILQSDKAKKFITDKYQQAVIPAS